MASMAGNARGVAGSSPAWEDCGIRMFVVEIGGGRPGIGVGLRVGVSGVAREEDEEDEAEMGGD